MEVRKARDYHLDNLKVLLIFLVVFGHMIEFYITESVILKGIYVFIYMFHMPLFIFISGYFSKAFGNKKIEEVKNLLVPYIIFNFIWYIAAYFVTKDWLMSFIYPGWTLWYLISLFFWRISLKYLIRIKYIFWISIIFGILIGIVSKGHDILALSRTVVFLPFFLLGYFAKKRNFRDIIKVNKIICVIGLVLLLILSLVFAFEYNIDYKFLYNSQAYMTSGISNIEGVMLRSLLYLTSLIAGVMVINLVPKRKTFFSHIGKSTMSIYLFHIYAVILLFILNKSWNTTLANRVILLISPMVITYLLSNKFIDKAYKSMINFINRINEFLFTLVVRVAKRIIVVFTL